MHRSPALSFLTIAFVLAAATGCSVPGTAPEPGSPSPSATASATPSASPAAPAFALPETCAEAFSATMHSRMADSQLPLNDPTLTMPSTDVDAGTQMLESVPHLRCTWGVASEVGITTDIAVVDAEQAASLQEAYAAAGFSCGPVEGDTLQTRCLRHESFDGELPGELGEIQVFRDGAWLSTKWLNVDVTGYADDMVASLWS